METNQYLINHYSSFNEDARLMSKHGSVEFLTTMCYIDKYIKPDDRVLEIGAGTGRYSHALVIFAAHVISDGCLLDEGFNCGNINVSEYIEKGLIDPETFASRSQFYFLHGF